MSREISEIINLSKEEKLDTAVPESAYRRATAELYVNNFGVSRHISLMQKIPYTKFWKTSAGIFWLKK